MAGSPSDRCRAYAGGIDLSFLRTKLLQIIPRYLRAGFCAVMIKVGELTHEDVRVFIAAVRFHRAKSCIYGRSKLRYEHQMIDLSCKGFLSFRPFMDRRADSARRL